MVDLRKTSPRRTAAVRFAAFCDLLARNLPWGLSSWVPANFLGFAMISGFTFGVDLILLTLLRSGLGWPLGVSVTLGYAVAFGLSFVLNRWLNFRSHAPVAGQAGRYVVVVASNYLAFILGVSTGLTALGVQYQIARLAAGACEAVYMYSMMRWVVFPAGKERPSR